MGKKHFLKNAVFVYDGAFRREGGLVYSGGGFPASVWSRYTAICCTLTVAARITDSSVAQGLTISSAPGVEFVNLPSISAVRARLHNKQLAKHKLREIIRDSELVIARLPSELGLLAAAVAREEEKPLAVEVVGSGFGALWNYGKLSYKAYAPFFHSRVRRAVRSADAAIYVTRHALQRQYPCPGLTGSASNVEVLVPEWQEISPSVVRRRLSPSIRVGLIGALASNYKGVDIAIRALAGLSRDGATPIELHVLGAGDPTRYMRLALSLGVSASVVFAGVRSSGNEVAKWLDGMDLYIQPSRAAEGLPRALIEAMARGHVCIGSTAGGIPELLDSDWIFPCEDHKALGRLLTRAMSSGSEEFQSWAVQNHSVAKGYDKLLNDQRRAEFWTEVAQSVRART